MSFTQNRKNGVVFDTADGLAATGGIRHAFSTRIGGVSAPPCDTLNFARTAGDPEENLLENFRRLGAAAGFDAQRLCCCRQIHSDRVVTASRAHAGRVRWDERPWDADALVTNEPGLALAVFTADCCPILFYDPAAHAVGAAHAGWRGTALGIAARTVEAMQRQYGSRPENIRAAIGAAIGPCCFETDGDVPAAMRTSLGAAAEPLITRVGEKFHVDCKGLNRQWLLSCGLLPEHIELNGTCTGCTPSLYWSHRKMGLRRGGMCAAIALCEEASV